MKKVIFLIILFVCAISICILSIALYFFVNRDDKESLSALLIITKPNISVERDGEVVQIDGEKYELIVGDLIETDENGIGYIIFSDNSSITLDSHTEIEIITHELSEDDFLIKIKQNLGRTWSRVENLFNKETSYTLETPSIIAAVRGTQFECEVIDSLETYCSSVEDEVTLSFKGFEEEEDLILAEGEAYFYSEGEAAAPLATEPGEGEAFFYRDDTNWTMFNECMSEDARKNLGEHKELNYLRDEEYDFECEFE